MCRISRQWKIELIEEKNPEWKDLFLDLIKNEITQSDIVALGYRKKQLEIFNKLFDSDTAQW